MKTLSLTATAMIAGQDFPLRLVLRGSIEDRTREVLAGNAGRRRE